MVTLTQCTEFTSLCEKFLILGEVTPEVDWGTVGKSERLYRTYFNMSVICRLRIINYELLLII